ncbi:MAG: ATP-binding protein [Olsenella sp.]|jgi:AAA+ ATPase superfamily predicted ATPase|nr:ATP-binding protein [Olsenella sp.]
MMRFVGRTRELSALAQHYDTGRFEMVVVYGRRRLGKTMLLAEFAKDKRCLFFTAQEKSDAINLREFSDAVAEFFNAPEVRFSTWDDAMAFVARRAAETAEPLLLVFDEFPYAAKANPALPSILQTAIDHQMLGTNMTLVLCGSNQGFMESEVLGHRSPLYGRRTAQIELKPFDCFDARLMLPWTTPEEMVEYYATFGGTPYYLSQIRSDQSYEQNVIRLFFDPYGLLYGEPQMLLRQELNDLALYTSVLDAIATGATRPQAIADKAGIASASVGKYLKTLEGLGIVERRLPFGENPVRSRKGIYRLHDPFYSFWYRFVSPNTAAIEMGAGETVARQSVFDSALDTYVGDRFEDVCLQWVERLNAQGKLGFIATKFGKWWGTDPIARERADVDVVVSDSAEKNMLLGECKWRNQFDQTEAIRLLEQRGNAFARGARKDYVLFSKRRASESTIKKAQERNDLRLVDAERMFQS